MKVRWSAEAVQDRLDIMMHIAADDSEAALEMDRLFGIAAGRLAAFPELECDRFRRYRLKRESHGRPRG